MMEAPRHEFEGADRSSWNWRGYLEQPIREDRYTTQRLPVERRFCHWRSLVSSLIEAAPSETEDVCDFHFDSRGYDLGKLNVAAFSSGAYRFRRTADQIRSNEVDHWMLMLRRSGSVSSHCGNTGMTCAPGQLFLKSFAYPFEGHASSGEAVALYIAREQLLPFAAQLDRLNHRGLTGITAQIAIEFLASMERLLPLSPVSDIPIFVETALIVIKGLAGQTDGCAGELARPAMVLRLETVKRYIQENLTSPNLEPDVICARMKISRRQLYYLFDQLGGVSNYIRTCRLRAFHDAVANPTEERPIHVLASAFGFSDAALFSRQFKAFFGYSPKEAREAKLFGYMPTLLPPKSLSEWLGQVR